MASSSIAGGRAERPGSDGGLCAGPPAGVLPRRTALPGPGENAVLDCTGGGRLGLRGPGTMEWIAAEGLALPGTVNSALTLSCGTGILRLGAQDVLLTAPVGDGGARLRALRAAWQGSTLSPRGHEAYRDEGWAWFVVTGEAAPRLMSRLSAADLRPRSMKVGQIAQTRALHLDAVIARLDRFGTVSYDIFLDMASVRFAREVLAETANGIDAGFGLAELRVDG